MSPLPTFNRAGDLPPGVHRATLAEVFDRLGRGTPQQRLVAQRLRRIYQRASSTEHLERFIVFGSFVTAAPAPNDVDVFLIMGDAFNAEGLIGETSILFSHARAQAYFGASIFWMRRVATLGNEEKMIEQWQIKRDGTRRGIVEVVTGDHE